MTIPRRQFLALTATTALSIHASATPSPLDLKLLRLTTEKDARVTQIKINGINVFLITSRIQHWKDVQSIVADNENAGTSIAIDLNFNSAGGSRAEMLAGGSKQAYRFSENVARKLNQLYDKTGLSRQKEAPLVPPHQSPFNRANLLVDTMILEPFFEDDRMNAHKAGEFFLSQRGLETTIEVLVGEAKALGYENVFLFPGHWRDPKGGHNNGGAVFHFPNGKSINESQYAERLMQTAQQMALPASLNITPPSKGRERLRSKKKKGFFHKIGTFFSP